MDEAPWCYKWGGLDGMGWDGMGYGCLGANNNKLKQYQRMPHYWSPSLDGVSDLLERLLLPLVLLLVLLPRDHLPG